MKGSSDIMVPSGMLSTINWEESEIKKEIEQLIADGQDPKCNVTLSKIVFCGHSLGGALATICALRFADEGFLDHFDSVFVRTFAAPQCSFESPMNNRTSRSADAAMELKSKQLWAMLDGLLCA